MHCFWRQIRQPSPRVSSVQVMDRGDVADLGLDQLGKLSILRNSGQVGLWIDETPEFLRNKLIQLTRSCRPVASRLCARIRHLVFTLSLQRSKACASNVSGVSRNPNPARSPYSAYACHC